MELTPLRGGLAGILEVDRLSTKQFKENGLLLWI